MRRLVSGRLPLVTNCWTLQWLLGLSALMTFALQHVLYGHVPKLMVLAPIQCAVRVMTGCLLALLAVGESQAVLPLDYHRSRKSRFLLKLLLFLLFQFLLELRYFLQISFSRLADGSVKRVMTGHLQPFLKLRRPRWFVARALQTLCPGHTIPSLIWQRVFVVFQLPLKLRDLARGSGASLSVGGILRIATCSFQIIQELALSRVGSGAIPSALRNTCLHLRHFGLQPLRLPLETRNVARPACLRGFCNPPSETLQLSLQPHVLATQLLKRLGAGRFHEFRVLRQCRLQLSALDYVANVIRFQSLELDFAARIDGRRSGHGVESVRWLGLLIGPVTWYSIRTMVDAGLVFRVTISSLGSVLHFPPMLSEGWLNRCIARAGGSRMRDRVQLLEPCDF